MDQPSEKLCIQPMQLKMSIQVLEGHKKRGAFPNETAVLKVLYLEFLIIRKNGRKLGNGYESINDG